MKKAIKIFIIVSLIFQPHFIFATERMSFHFDEGVILNMGEDWYEGSPDGDCFGGGCSAPDDFRYFEYDDDYRYDSGDERHSFDREGDSYHQEDLHYADQRMSEDERANAVKRMDLEASESVELVESNIQRYYQVFETKYDDNCSIGICHFSVNDSPTVNDLKLQSSRESADTFVNDLLEGLPKEENFNSYEIENIQGFLTEDTHYRSSQSDKLNKVHNRLTEFRIKGPQQSHAKKEALKNLRAADDAFLDDNQGLGNELFDTAVFLADLATDIIPFTSVPKDFYRAVVGADPFTGEQLSPLERVIAAGFASLNTATLGAAGVAIAGIKNIGKVAKATPKEIKFAEKLTEAIEKSPLRVDVLVQGTSSELTLIGRDMANVNKVADSLGKSGVPVNTLKDFPASVNRDWKQLMAKHNGWIPEDALVASEMYLYNKSWIQKALGDGHTIVDIGNPSRSGLSPFYEMEKREIKTYLEKVSK